MNATAQDWITKEMNKIAKLRIDSWDAALTDAQRWTVFDKSRRASWAEVAEWIAAEYGVEAPSRSAFYRFLDRMRGMESGHRLTTGESLYKG